MKNDKKWLKESINELKTIFNDSKMGEYETGRLDGYNHASMLIDYLDEPEKPVIPQFAADYIEQSKKDNDSINQVFAFMDDKEDKDLWHWLFPSMYEEKRANQEVFMRAWLDGYEVEKDPKYYVLDKEGATLLKKSSVSEGVAKSVGTNIHSVKSWKDEKKYQLTEQEIKDYDERFWPFAVKVEEMEE